MEEEFQMRNIIIGIGLLLCLTACTTTKPPVYQPEPVDDADLVVWEEAYPIQYADWATSVHGEAYLSGDTNAPTCNDCHDAPVEGEKVKTAAFHLQIPARCARCHDDTAHMADYDIATDVYETYLADFHGATINYYAQTEPTAIRDEAVCSDCHGTHDIYPQDDERSFVSETNLQATCTKCHTNASEAFTSAYGHYRPIQSPVSTADSPIVFIVKLAYQALIPITLGGMLGYIALDVGFRAKKKKQDKAKDTESKSEE